MPQKRLVKEKELLVAQSCLTLCNPTDCSPPGSSVHGISQARILEWVAMPSSKGSSWPRDQTRVPCIVGRFLIVWATRETPQKVWRFLKSSQWRRSFKGKQKSQNPKELIQRFDYANIKKKKICMANTSMGKVTKTNDRPRTNICNTYHKGLISSIHKGSITELGSITPPKGLWAKVIQRKLRGSSKIHFKWYYRRQRCPFPKN